MNKHLLKPACKEPVIATERGWVVERTGEVLVSVKNLHLLVNPPVAVVETQQQVSDLLDTLSDATDEQIDADVVQPQDSDPSAPKVLMGYYYSPYLVKKKMGRPAGSKNTKQ